MAQAVPGGGGAGRGNRGQGGRVGRVSEESGCAWMDGWRLLQVTVLLRGSGARVTAAWRGVVQKVAQMVALRGDGADMGGQGGVGVVVDGGVGSVEGGGASLPPD